MNIECGKSLAERWDTWATLDDEAVHKITGAIGKNFYIDRSHSSLWKCFHEARAHIDKVETARHSRGIFTPGICKNT